MERIKKIIKQALTTGTTVQNGKVYYRIVPDMDATYNLKIQLNEVVRDMGFFDAYVLDDEFDYLFVTSANMSEFESLLTGGTNTLTVQHSDGQINGIDLPVVEPYVVSGASPSRLSDLEKYYKGGTFFDKYVQSTSPNINGVNPNESNISGDIWVIVYYIDNITYKDVKIISENESTTTFSFVGESYNSDNFINKPIYKNPNKENIVGNPKVHSDVFIDRQEISAFKNNYNLEFIENLVELETFAAGNYFNIVNNK